MADFNYARGRIGESIRFISEEMKEFDQDYIKIKWEDYQKDKKIQKLIDRTLENILTALIEVSGTLLTEEGTSGDSYGDIMKKTGVFFGFTEKEQAKLSKLAYQKNRLAHRYLNYRWETVKMYSENRSLIKKLLIPILEREKKKESN